MRYEMRLLTAMDAAKLKFGSNLKETWIADDDGLDQGEYYALAATKDGEEYMARMVETEAGTYNEAWEKVQ